MTLTTEQLSAVETTKEFRALLKYMRAIAKAEPESVKEKCELESGLRQYASQKTIKAIVEHIDALEFAVAANREAQPVALVDRRPAASGSICWQNGGKDLPHGTELFTAPPAPAVPEEISSAIRHLKDTLVACNRFNYCADAVNLVEDACRAAMLAQPVSSGYTLPEGFKLMPLEMTDEIGEAIAMEANCCGGIALDIYDAALAAAPEGGNG